MKRCFFILSLFLYGCAPTMTVGTFEQIPIGAPITEVEEEMGSPYSVTKSDGGSFCYRYLERIETGPGVVSQNTYLLIVQDGKVISKKRVQNADCIQVKSF